MTSSLNTASEARRHLRSLADPEQAGIFRSFFKTGPGEYGEGDVFLGIKVPVLRDAAQMALGLPLPEIGKLLASDTHEDRLLALLVMTYLFPKAGPSAKKELYDFYMASTSHINNWDLVDLSCYRIVGPYLMDKPRAPLYRLARSSNMWERRISVISTMAFIRSGQMEDTFAICRILLDDQEDLIHKATGWMLREAGKRDKKAETDFLKTTYKTMPRTMLRYAIERFPEQERKRYLLGKI